MRASARAKSSAVATVGTDGAEAVVPTTAADDTAAGIINRVATPPAAPATKTALAAAAIAQAGTSRHQTCGRGGASGRQMDS
jgi:hypothetical protein